MPEQLKTPSQQDAADRIQPRAIEVERAVLGAMLIDKGAIGRVLEVLGDETAFYHTAHRKIYAAIVSLYDRGEPADQITVTEELNRRGALERVGGAVEIAGLAGEMATAVNAEYHAGIVLDRALRRRLIEAATQTAAECYADGEEIREVIDRAEQRVFGIAERELGKGIVPLESVLHDTVEIVQKAQERSGALLGVTTGYADLDEITAGLQGSDLIIVASRPAMGKTAFSLCVARNAAVEANTPVLIFSLEMSLQQLAQRLLCAEARVDSHRLRTGRLSEDEWQHLAYRMGKLEKAPIFIDDTPGLSVLEIRAKARRAKTEHNIGMVIVDYLQLVTVNERSDNREQEIARVSRALKSLAKEIDVPVVACAQLSRAVEARERRRPQLSDLRESGSLEQDADVVIFLYRPEVYDLRDEEGNSQEGEAELIIGKQRNGPIGSVHLTWIGECGRFETKSNRDAPFSSGQT